MGRGRQNHRRRQAVRQLEGFPARDAGLPGPPDLCRPARAADAGALSRRRLGPRGFRARAKPARGAQRHRLEYRASCPRLDRSAAKRSSSSPAKPAVPSPAPRSTSTPINWQKGHTKIESKTTDAEGRVWFAPRAQRSGPYFLLAKKGRDVAFDSDYLYLYGQSRAGRDERRPHLHRPVASTAPARRSTGRSWPIRDGRDLGRLRPAANARRLGLARGHQRPARRRGHGRRPTPSARRAASSSSRRRAGPSAAGASLVPRRLRRGARRGVQAADLRGHRQGPGEAAAPQPARDAQGRGPLLFRPPGRHGRRGRLAGQARAGLSALVVVGTPADGRSQTVAGGRAEDRRGRRRSTSTFTPQRRREEGRRDVGRLLPLHALGRRHGRGRRDALGLALVPAGLRQRRGPLDRGQTRFFRADAQRHFHGHAAPTSTGPPSRAGHVARRPARPAGEDAPARRPAPARPAPRRRTARRTRRRPATSCGPAGSRRLAGQRSCACGRKAAESGHGRRPRTTPRVERPSRSPALKPGAYRLLYETKDDFGAVCRESLDFLVAGKQTPPSSLPLFLSAERPSVPVGGNGPAYASTAAGAASPCFSRRSAAATLWERRWIEAGKDGGVVEIPVTEDLRGGFGVASDGRSATISS